MSIVAYHDDLLALGRMATAFHMNLRNKRTGGINYRQTTLIGGVFYSF